LTSAPTIIHKGVGSVYPTDNFHFDHRGPAKIPCKGISIYLQGVLAGARTASRQNIEFAAVASKLRQVFDPLGIGPLDVKERTPQDAITAGFQRRSYKRGEAWMAKDVLMKNPDAPLSTDGIDMPFFTYWVFFETNMTLHSATEGGEAEDSFSSRTAKERGAKLLRFPTALLGALSQPFLTLMRRVIGLESATNALVNLIAHEVGHGLGLGHGLIATGAAYALVPGAVAGEAERCRGVMRPIASDAGFMPLHFFGPVHTATLRARYR
jgi:hypothetical protein